MQCFIKGICEIIVICNLYSFIVAEVCKSVNASFSYIFCMYPCQCSGFVILMFDYIICRKLPPFSGVIVSDIQFYYMLNALI